MSQDEDHETNSPFGSSSIRRMREHESLSKLDGIPTSNYGDRVADLKRRGASEELERLLLRLIDQNELANKHTGYGVAPAWYWELAVYYRKQKEYGREVALLERYFEVQRTPPGQMHERLRERLSRARTLASRAG